MSRGDAKETFSLPLLHTKLDIFAAAPALWSWALSPTAPTLPTLLLPWTVLDPSYPDPAGSGCARLKAPRPPPPPRPVPRVSAG